MSCRTFRPSLDRRSVAKLRDLEPTRQRRSTDLPEVWHVAATQRRRSGSDGESELYALLSPADGHVGQARDAEAARQGPIRRGLDNVGRQKGQRQSHAGRALVDGFSLSDGLNVRNGSRHDLVQPGPSPGYAVQQLGAGFGSDGTRSTVVTPRPDHLALAPHGLRRPAHHDWAGRACQRRSDSRPAGRSKTRPVDRASRHGKGPDRGPFHVGLKFWIRRR